MVDLTVVICTYNGAQRLPLVLDRLRSQTNVEAIQWEILIVNNNSTDNTAEVIQSYQASWLETVPLRSCFEARQGAAFARQRGVEDAHGSLIGFLDDDNFPHPNWIAEAVSFGNRHPNVGAYGSKILPMYEIEPPVHFERIAIFLAIRAVNKTFSYTASPTHANRRFFPPSAGLVVRKPAWLEAVPNEIRMTGRIKDSLTAGEDTEALTYMRQSGWEIWHNADMQIHHQIPPSRLTREYLAKLLHDNGLGRHPLRMIGIPQWQQPLLTVAHFINDLRKLIWHYIQHRHELPDDTVAWCEMQVFIGSLKSPFFYWRQS